MEDLAYIYLALNHEIKRHQELKEERLLNSSLIWAPPIPIEPDRATHPSPEPPDDHDSTFHPYQGFFYL